MLKEKGEKKSFLSLLTLGKFLYFILVGGGGEEKSYSFSPPRFNDWSLKPIWQDRLTREKILAVQIGTEFHRETRVQEAADDWGLYTVLG